MKINFCLPIIKNNKHRIIEIIKNNISEYQYFEIWLDYVDGLDEAFITDLINLLGEKLIVLFRRQNLEQIQMPFKKRFEIIDLLDNTKSLLDLDITQKDELNYLINNKKNIIKIISYHNYSETPRDKSLIEIMNEMRIYNPAIIKIACMCIYESDAIRLLQIQQVLKAQNNKQIILGMGKFGTITRVFGTLWGNEMIFAPINREENSAPGQLTKQQLEKIFDSLNN